jgi:GTP diphosphokinase / guanosine-3',5'-bis(diphosphate) 3'-diphosphatase
MNATTTLAKALNFAAQKHIDQKRKGEHEEPYIVHLTEVAELLADATRGNDATVVAAGLLHDTIEDTGTTKAELVAAFGQNIADIVAECTDDKSLPKAERKRIQIIHAEHASPRAKMVKMADKISNMHAILESPPAGWDETRKLEYFHWAKQVVDNCRGVNERLEQKFDAMYERGMKAFKQPKP